MFPTTDIIEIQTKAETDVKYSVINNCLQVKLVGNKTSFT